MTPGQEYAIKYLSTLKFKFISSPEQIKRGNLVFEDPNKNKWGIWKNGGYIRKMTPDSDRWQIVSRQSYASSQIDDDQYMDLAEEISIKYSNERKKQSAKIEMFGKYADKIKTFGVVKSKKGFGLKLKFQTCFVSFSDIRKALDLIYKDEKYQHFFISSVSNSDVFIPNSIQIKGYDDDSRLETRIVFSNASFITGFTKCTKQFRSRQDRYGYVFRLINETDITNIFKTF